MQSPDISPSHSVNASPVDGEDARCITPIHSLSNSCLRDGWRLRPATVSGSSGGFSYSQDFPAPTSWVATHSRREPAKDCRAEFQPSGHFGTDRYGDCGTVSAIQGDRSEKGRSPSKPASSLKNTFTPEADLRVVDPVTASGPGLRGENRAPRSLDLSVDGTPDVGQGYSMTIFQKASKPPIIRVHWRSFAVSNSIYKGTRYPSMSTSQLPALTVLLRNHSYFLHAG